MIIYFSLFCFIALTIFFANLWLYEKEKHQMTELQKRKAEGRIELLLLLDELESKSPRAVALKSIDLSMAAISESKKAKVVYLSDFHEDADRTPDWITRAKSDEESW